MAPTNNTTPLLALLFLFLLSFSSVSLADEDCVYTMYIRTGSVIKGGTDSVITMRLYDLRGEYIEIPNIAAWGGLMGPGHNYFERHSLDIFSGRGPCLTGPVCALNLTSDGSGWNNGWYCNYVEITTSGIHAPCHQQLFTVEQWLPTRSPPFELTAIRNNCDSYNGPGPKKSASLSSSSSAMTM